jgi:hypothetical protein
MLKLRKLALLAACAVLSAPYVANAAVVASVSGDVLVSKGDGFAPISSATELAPGGRVLVRPGGLAMITYPSDCAVRVGAGVWQVQPTAPCAPGNHEIDFTNRMNDGMAPSAPPPPPREDYTGLWLGAGVGIFTIGIVCITDWCTEHTKPASP